MTIYSERYWQHCGQWAEEEEKWRRWRGRDEKERVENEEEMGEGGGRKLLFLMFHWISGEVSVTGHFTDCCVIYKPQHLNTNLFFTIRPTIAQY